MKKVNAPHPDDAPTNIDNLIEKIRVVKLKSRAVLLEEDIILLDECEEELLKMKENPPSLGINHEDVGRIVFLILKFLFSAFQAD